jgi:hypothetical protein
MASPTRPTPLLRVLIHLGDNSLARKTLKRFLKKYSKQRRKQARYRKNINTSTSLKQKYTKTILSEKTK